MKNKGRITLLILSIVMLMFGILLVYALLIDKKEIIDPIRYQMGELDFDVSGGLMYNDIYPGVNLVTEDYVITNNSTVNVNLRIIMKFYLDDLVNEVDINDYTEVFDFNTETPILFDLSDDYYLYIKNDGILLPGQNITLFTTLILDGYQVTNPFQGTDFKIKLVIQAKQADHVEWTDLGDKFIN